MSGVLLPLGARVRVSEIAFMAPDRRTRYNGREGRVLLVEGMAPFGMGWLYVVRFDEGMSRTGMGMKTSDCLVATDSLLFWAKDHWARASTYEGEPL